MSKSPRVIAETSIPHAAALVAKLRRLGDAKYRAGMARFAIPADQAFGVPVGEIQKLARQIKGGKRQQAESAVARHKLALDLWATARYEARLLAAFVDDPASVTAAQMDRWARDFAGWADCDTACFHLFDRVPDKALAFRKVAQWSRHREEFVKRAAFALLASLALHDKTLADEPFAACLPLIETAATDERNFVKKGVSWALRGVGRRSPALHAACVALAARLAASEDKAARWVGKDAHRELTSPAVVRKIAAVRKSR